MASGECHRQYYRWMGVWNLSFLENYHGSICVGKNTKMRYSGFEDVTQAENYSQINIPDVTNVSDGHT